MKITTSVFLFLASAFAEDPVVNPVNLSFHHDPSGKTYPFQVTRHNEKIHLGPIPSPAEVTSVQLSPSTPTVHCELYCGGSTPLVTLTESLTYYTFNPPKDLNDILVSCSLR